jgi:hypothetical protein
MPILPGWSAGRNITLNVLERIAQALGVTEAELVTRDPTSSDLDS